MFVKYFSDRGLLLLAEIIPQQTQRLYQLLQTTWLPKELFKKLALAEEAIYADKTDPMVNWDCVSLKEDLESLGISVEVQQERSQTSMLITPALISRWFAENQTAQSRTTYKQHLAKILTEAEIEIVEQAFVQHLCHQTVNWSSAIAFVKISS